MTCLRILLPLCLALTAAACSKPEPAPPPPAAKVEAPATPWTPYVCADGRVVQALYPDHETARLKLEGGAYQLKIAMSGSGARYVGEGLQWWTKGEEGMLAPLKAGQEIADEPGVRCVPPAQAAVDPPAPGTPGGLPDDRTPLDERPAKAGSGQAAATVVETYYALLETGKTAEAAKLRSDGVAEDLKPYGTLGAQVGKPGALEGAAGSLYVEVPVSLYGRMATGEKFLKSGKVTLRRVNNVPGASPEQLRWRIATISVK